MAGTSYVRQSSMADGDTITAALFNDEFNRLLTAFSYASSSTTGHRHDGTAGEGGNIHTIGDQDFLNKVLTTGNTWEFYVEVASAAAKQLVLQDGALVPNADSDLDLGTSSLYFKNAYIDSITTTGNLSVGGNLDVTGTLDLSDANFTNAGDIQLDSITGDGDTNTSITFSGSDVITFTTGGETQFTLNNGSILPTTDNDIDLGSSSYEFKDAYFDGTVTSDAFAGPLTGNVTGNCSGTAATVTTAAQTNITSLGTLTALTVDNLGINGNTITANSGALNLTPTSGSAIVLDGTINVDAGVVTGASSITSTAFVGNITGNVTGNASGTALTVTQAAQTNITSLGTLTALTVDNLGINGNTITANSGALNLTPASGSAIVLDGTISVDAGVVTGATAITLSGELDAGSLDVSGDADIDGTLEADAITVNGTALNEFIADTVGAMVGSNTESGITVAYQDTNNTLDFTVGTLNQDTTGTAAIATTVTITDNESTNENNAIIFTAGGDVNGGNIGLESDGDLTYNPSTGLLSSAGVTASGTVTFGTLSDGTIGVTAWVDEDDMSSNSATLVPTQQSVKAYVDGSGGGTMSSFILEDADGTEVSISNAEEVKFIGSGITINWTDITPGSDGDPFDLTFTVDAAQTGITSLLATDIKIGEDDQTKIDFETADEIHFYAANAEQVYVADGIFGPQTDNDVDLGASGVEWKDAYFDGTVTTDALVADTADINGGSIDGATLGTNSAITQAVIDNVNINGATIGHTDDTDLITLADGIVTVAGEVSLTTLDIGGTNVTSTAAELNALDGITAVVGELNALDIGATAVGTAVASKAVILDSNKDYTGIRNLTITGELDAATLDVSGNVDIDGTLEADGITSNSVAVKVAGKETIYVPAGAMYPNTTAGCSALTQVELANGPELKCLDFATGADDFAQFTVCFPKSWNEGTVTFQAFWTVTGTNAGTVAWGLSGGSMANDASINTAFGTAVVATALAHSGTSNDMMVSAASGAVTIANAAVDTMTFFEVHRDVSADDQSGDARLLGIKLFFTTDAANDA